MRFKKRHFLFIFFLALFVIVFNPLKIFKTAFADWNVDFNPPTTTPTPLTPGCLIVGSIVQCSSTSFASIILACGGETPSPPQSECKTTYHRLIGAPTWTTYIGAFNLNNGDQLEFYSVDNAGNFEAVKTLTTSFSYKVTASVNIDAGYNNCVAGSQPYNLSSVGISLYQFPSHAFIGSGTYAPPVDFLNNISGNYQLEINLGDLNPGYKLIGTRITPVPSLQSGVSNGVSFSLTQDEAVIFCVSNLHPWLQTDTGDVRMKDIYFRLPSSPLPPPPYVSTDVNYPSIFFSSVGPADFDPPPPPVTSSISSPKGWVVSNEYGANNNFETVRGSASYTSYISKINKLGMGTTPLSSISGCSNPSSSCDLSGGLGLVSKIYTVSGNLNITNYSHTSGTHVVILVNGDATINTTRVDGKAVLLDPAGNNLFVLAAKGYIYIGESVGTTYDSNVNTLDGVYSAEGNIVIQGDGTNVCNVNPAGDKRLNVGGALIANADYPFKGNSLITDDPGGGQINNQRSLCIHNLGYPSLRVNTRTDFITRLTDFYKESDYRWEEVEP